jgi:hypothetical protein
MQACCICSFWVADAVLENVAVETGREPAQTQLGELWAPACLQRPSSDGASIVLLLTSWCVRECSFKMLVAAKKGWVMRTWRRKPRMSLTHLAKCCIIAAAWVWVQLSEMCLPLHHQCAACAAYPEAGLVLCPKPMGMAFRFLPSTSPPLAVQAPFKLAPG